MEGPQNMAYYYNMVSDIDECQSAPCFNEGTCFDGMNQYTCFCQHGFDGQQCEIGKSCIFMATNRVSTFD